MKAGVDLGRSLALRSLTLSAVTRTDAWLDIQINVAYSM